MADNQGLTLLQKIKLLLGAKKVAQEVTNLTPNVTSEPGSKATIWSKLDGTKSITGLLMIITYYVAPKFNVHIPDIFLQVGMAWAGVGFLHKFDKSTSILTAVMTALTEANKKLNENSETINGDKK